MMENGLYNENKDITGCLKERPIGVSGVLRCHNCADFLDACIESCIDGLDELVAVYHDCVDATPEILRFKQKQYPDKIKVYEYLPYIFPVEMNEAMSVYAKILPSCSIHLMSGYYNYAFSKTNYRYVVKIDADQIYFSQYWERICDAYRSTEKVRFNLKEYVAYGLYHAYICCFSHGDIYQFRLFEKLVVLLNKFYFSYIEKRVIRDKVSVSLSGINLLWVDEQWIIGLGDSELEDVFPLFNGVRDTFFFELVEQTYFEKHISSEAAFFQRVIEIMCYHKEILDGGFFWFHLKPSMQSQKDKYRKIFKELPKKFVPLDMLKRLSFQTFIRRYHPFYPVRFLEPVLSYFYSSMRKKIPWLILDDLNKQYNLSLISEFKTKLDMKDYYLEFHDMLDYRLESFISDQELKCRGSLTLGRHNISVPLLLLLFYQLTQEREYYNSCRINGQTVKESMKRVDKFLDMFEDAQLQEEQRNDILVDIQDHPWYEVLSEYEGQLLIYIFNERQLHYLVPLINNINFPVFILSEYELLEDMDFPDYVTAMTIEHSKYRVFENPYIEYNFPILFRYANTFSLMLDILKPSKVICLEGCHMQEQLLAIVANDFMIPSICIQQGWPSFMRTGFRRLPFRYYFTWGERFSRLWERYNPRTEFLPMGYMYEMTNPDLSKKKCITFFLQSPHFLSDINYYNEILELVSESADTHPDIEFLVREHPEYRMEKRAFKKLEIYPNVHMVSNWELKEVYGLTLIIVSHFSSALMEGIVHGCIPLVYDLPTGSRYCPDVEKESLGRIVKTKEDFFLCLKEILEEYRGAGEGKQRAYLRLIEDRRKQWFAAVDSDAIERMVDFINCKL